MLNRTQAMISFALLLSTLAAPAIAAPESYEEVTESTEVFSEMVKNPETQIPAALLRESQAIAVITNIRQGGFILGGRRGDGVMLTRQTDGSWSNPAFINLTGGSIGLQAGFKSTDLILVFPSKAALDKVLSGDFELGGSVSGTAGPVGKAATESLEGFGDDIYAYSRSEGLFGSVSLEGSELSFDDDDSAEFYGQPLTVKQIFAGQPTSAPAVVQSLKNALRLAE